MEFEATLEEEVLEDDPTTGLKDRIPAFHGYSANGNVTARFVYANYGTYEDFEELREAGIDIEGKIVIAKYGSIFRGLKVKRAEDLGAVGVILYSDPGDDGEVTEVNGYKAYPNGPARNPSSLQRGSVEYLSALSVPLITSAMLTDPLQAWHQATQRPSDIRLFPVATGSPWTAKSLQSRPFHSPTPRPCLS